jgi:hypothetical protein
MASKAVPKAAQAEPCDNAQQATAHERAAATAAHTQIRRVRPKQGPGKTRTKPTQIAPQRIRTAYAPPFLQRTGNASGDGRA